VSKNIADYAQAGVDTHKAKEALGGLLKWISPSCALRRGKAGEVVVKSGYYAAVIKLTDTLWLALTTDGVGTKLLVAEKVGRYDTVGIDCIAMNVNDLICVGAEPLAMLDYLAVQKLDASFLEELGRGLYRGAELAGISIPGGELAQLPEMLQGTGEGLGFDLVGSAVGIVSPDRVIVGRDIQEGDVLIGLASSGLHSNGYTLARKVLLHKAGLSLEQGYPELGRTLGEELLEPTRIYVKPLLELFGSGLHIKALFHITGDGLFNLTRTQRSVGYIIEFLPDPPPIFSMIQRYGDLADKEMYEVFNMGVGFCVALPENEVSRVLQIMQQHDIDAWRLGYVTEDEERKIILQPKGLVGKHNIFHNLSR